MNFSIWDLALRILIIYLGIGFGVILKNFPYFDKDRTEKLLSKVLLYFVFPFLIFTSIFDADFSKSLDIIFLPILFGFAIMLMGTFFAWLYLRNKPLEPGKKGAGILCTGFPNSVFLPFPIIIIVLGVDGLVSATFFTIAYLIVYNTIGSYIAVNYGEQKEKLDRRGNLKLVITKLIQFPPTIGVIVALILKLTFQIPSFLDAVIWLPFPTETIELLINIFSWISLLIALLIVGFNFDFRLESITGIYLPQLSLIRLIVVPVVGYIVLLIFDFVNLRLASIFAIPLMIQAMSGPAVVNIAFSDQFGLDTKTTSVYITIMTGISIILLMPYITLLFFLFPLK